MPRRFTKLGADLWRPVRLDRSNAEISRRYFMFQARLKPGVTLDQAAADMNVIAHRLAQIYPDNYPKQFNVNAISWVDSIVGQFKTTLYTLAAAVGLLLLIACSNVANMLLTRATAREREMAIRVALGASRWRVIRQLLVESILLAAGGAALGCLFAYGGTKAIAALIPEGTIPREAVIRLNTPVLAFSLLVAMLTTLLFGLVPALQTVRRDMVEPLKDAGKGVSGGFRRGRLRSVLVVAEVALSLLLLVGAGLLMRSFVALQTVDLGLDPENILVARLPLPRGQYTTAAEKQRFFRTLLDRLHALPGVVVATETTTLPPYGGIGTDIEIPGKTHTEKWRAIFQLCSEGYFQTLGLRLTRGRTFTAAEVDGAASWRSSIRRSSTSTSGRTIPSASASSSPCSKRCGRAQSRIRSSKSWASSETPRTRAYRSQRRPRCSFPSPSRARSSAGSSSARKESPSCCSTACAGRSGPSIATWR